MLVKDLMTPDPVHISPLRSVAEAADIMQKQGVRHLPVVDDEGKLVGLLTRSSLGKALPGMGTGLTRFEFNYLTSSTAVSDVMIKEPILITEDEGVEDAARIMNVNRISSLLVMRDDKLAGIITDTDLFGALLELLGAHRSGVRLTVHIPDRTGQLARVTAAIAEPGGYVSAVGGWYVRGERNIYGAVLKIENLTLEQVRAAIDKLPDAVIVDLRGEPIMHQE
jgi:acetoin utilization protein AcuB